MARGTLTSLRKTLDERARERRRGRSNDHDEEEWCPQEQRPDGSRQADQAPVGDDLVLGPSECLRDDERGEERRREQADDAGQRRREVPAAEDDRTDGLQQHGGAAYEEDDEPDGAHRFRHPSRQAALAATIGTPAGATGRSASAMPAPATAAASARRV